MYRGAHGANELRLIILNTEELYYDMKRAKEGSIPPSRLVRKAILMSGEKFDKTAIMLAEAWLAEEEP